MRRLREFSEGLGDFPADLDRRPRGTFPPRALPSEQHAVDRVPARIGKFFEAVPIESGILNVTAIGFQGLTVPADQRWVLYFIGAITDTLDGDQTIRLQTSIRFPSGQNYITDVSGIAVSGAAGQTNRGGPGIYPPGGILVPPNFSVGVNVDQITVGAAASVQLFIGALRRIESL
mgnify:CR=1 FL=1